MFGVGPEELAFVLLLALIVLGPERLPKVARDLGRVIGDLRRTSDELRDEFLNADKYLEAKATTASPSSAPAEGAAESAASPESASSGPPGESDFDREMREARERLSGS